MTRNKRHPRRPDDRSTQITLAVLTGLIASAVRAVTDWLLHHLT